MIYDYGGVFSGSPFGAIRDYEASLGLPTGAVLDLLFGRSYAHGEGHGAEEHVWHKLETGRATMDEWHQHVQAQARERIGRTIDLSEAFSGGGTGISWEMVHHVRRVKGRGIRTAILTNNVKEFGDFWRDSIPLDEIADVVVDSSHVGMRKPDAEIYLLTASRLGAEPEACLFVDDLPANVDAAVAVGMVGVLVAEDRAAAIAEIEAYVAGANT